MMQARAPQGRQEEEDQRRGSAQCTRACQVRAPCTLTDLPAQRGWAWTWRCSQAILEVQLLSDAACALCAAVHAYRTDNIHAPYCGGKVDINILLVKNPDAKSG